MLAGLSMKRPSVYIDQWTEENAQWHLLENIKEQSQFNCDSPQLGVMCCPSFL